MMLIEHCANLAVKLGPNVVANGAVIVLVPALVPHEEAVSYTHLTLPTTERV